VSLSARQTPSPRPWGPPLRLIPLYRSSPVPQGQTEAREYVDTAFTWRDAGTVDADLQSPRPLAA
jgi:hypothetical protein